MLVDLAVTFDPGVELALADGKPGDEVGDRYFRLPGPSVNEVNNGVSRIMGNPDAG